MPDAAHGAQSGYSVVADAPDLEAAADALARALGATRGGGAPVWLVVERDGLALRSDEFPSGVRIDLDALGVAGRAGARRDQPLARAIGLRSGVRTVVDATAGLLGDAFLLASFGCEVTCVERHAALAAMQRDALARAAARPDLAPIGARITLVHADAREWLSHLPPERAPDAVYVDPMHPPRRKAALVKKEMRLLRALVGEDADAPALAEAALRVARRRVVVKRPSHAPDLLPNPVGTHRGRAVRYDVYTPHTPNKA